DKKIYDFNYRAVKESIERALKGQPKIDTVISQAKTASHPFAGGADKADRSRSRTSPRRGAGLPPLDCVSSLASIHGGACVLMRKLLLQLDSSRLPSVFDRVVAYDGGADEVMSYGGVTDADVRDLIHGCIFTRGPKDLKNTAVFVGGADIAVGEQLLAAATAAMFKPFTVSAMLDSNGSNTTAVAAVAKMANVAGDVRGKRVLIVAGTGPVG